MPPPHAAGAMGPPSRPAVEKATDTAELTDVIAQSGIDIRDEEKYLTAYFSQDHNSQAPGPNGAPSYSSALPAGSDLGRGSGFHPATQAFDLTRYSQGNQDGFHPPGAWFSQPYQPRQTEEQIVQEERRAALRRREQIRSLHLNDPFLNGNSVCIRLGKRAHQLGMRLPVDGVMEPLPRLHPTSRIQTTSLTGTDGVTITAATGYFVQRDAPIAEMLALLSLACGHRARGVLEDAAVLARNRRVGSQGQVPMEWVDLALSNQAEAATAGIAAGPNSPQSRTGPDTVTSPLTTNPLKRSFSATHHPPPTSFSSSGEAPASAPTVTIPNDFARQLRGLAAKDRSREEARRATRARKAGVASAAGDGAPKNSAAGGPGTANAGSGGAGTAGGLLGELAPEAEAVAPAGKKLTKKEQAKLQSARLDEAHQHRSANYTAQMMLGSGKSRFGKVYSWMNVGNTDNRSAGGGGLGGSGGIGAGAGAPAHGTGSRGIGHEGASGGGRSGPAAHGAAKLGQRMGEWREDGDKGARIQLRDWLLVLEREDGDRVSVARAFAGIK
ncbi:MAG: hypothetical protein M1826_001054 [Phylliscum demangeonii]|nr:MAG: hypothetical protein M1826_001054 [Phylliscum demangeonii]